MKVVPSVENLAVNLVGQLVDLMAVLKASWMVVHSVVELVDCWVDQTVVWWADLMAALKDMHLVVK